MTWTQEEMMPDWNESDYDSEEDALVPVELELTGSVDEYFAQWLANQE